MPEKTNYTDQLAPGRKLFINHPEYSITTEDLAIPKNDEHRVKTWIVKNKKTDQLSVCLSPMSRNINNRSISDALNIGSNKIKRATPEELQKIGMVPDMCHPFPDFNLLNQGVIEAIIMDTALHNIDGPCFFPIYYSRKKVATVSLPSRTYLHYLSCFYNKEGESEKVFHHFISDSR